MSQFIVQPAKGYAFIFDIRSADFQVTKLLEPAVVIQRTIRLTVTTQRDLDAINAALDRLKELPGYVE
jgi:spore coat polysaccharide biosynthesis protein SpsF (cytidylyltransferase family)